jgi:butyryl-CoA dehydrogenase
MTTEPQVTDFELSPELSAFQAEARRFSQEEVQPGAAQRDREQSFPGDLIKRAAELGFLKTSVPTEYGGSGMGSLATCLMLEEVNAACASTGVTISVHNSLFCSPLAKWGSDDQKSRYFPRVVEGEWLGAYCLSEAASGSDAAALVCKATRDGDDWILNGPKLWITTGSEAGIYIVFARSGEDRVKGISAFLVERGYEGVSIGKKERKLGIKASPTTEVLFENVRVPGKNLIGEEGRGFSIALDTLDGGRLGIAAQALGIAAAAIDVIRNHLSGQQNAKGRNTSSQHAQWTLADLCAERDAYRFLMWRAAVLRDRGESVGAQSAMAKLCSSKLANRAARAAVELLGLGGCNDTSSAERLVRDARITEIYEGATDIQRLVIARSVLA